MTARHGGLKVSLGPPALPAPETGRGPQRRTAAERAPSEVVRASRLERYRAVRRPGLDGGLNISETARRLGMTFRRRRFRSGHRFRPCHACSRPTAPLESRWAEGYRNARRLWREIRAQGYPRSAKPVHRWAQK